MLIDKGVPGVRRTLIRPPSSQLGPITKLNARRLWPRRNGEANTTHDWIAIPRRLDARKARRRCAQAAEKAEGEEEKLDAEGANTIKGVATGVMLNAQSQINQV
jgi:hypothetical protein